MQKLLDGQLADSPLALQAAAAHGLTVHRTSGGSRQRKRQEHARPASSCESRSNVLPPQVLPPPRNDLWRSRSLAADGELSGHGHPHGLRDVTYRVYGDGLCKATVREATKFTIETVDFSGVRVARGGEPLFVAIRGVARARARIYDHGDGLYTVEWKPAVSGHYTIAVSLFGVAVPGSPFALEATTPEPSPLHCTVHGVALERAAARVTQSFEVSFRDKLGATTHAVELDVFAEPVIPGSPRQRASPLPHSMSVEMRDHPEPTVEDAAERPKTTSPASVANAADASLAKTKSMATRNQQLAEDMALEQREKEERVKMKRYAGRRKAAPVKGDMNTTRHRRIRVKVKDRPLIVRAGIELDSPEVGQLLPGAVVTVIEERVLPGNVRARIALDWMGKEDADGVKSEHGLTFRGALGSFRANAHTSSAAIRGTASPVARSVAPAASSISPKPREMAPSDLAALSGTSTVRSVATIMGPSEATSPALPRTPSSNMPALYAHAEAPVHKHVQGPAASESESVENVGECHQSVHMEGIGFDGANTVQQPNSSRLGDDNAESKTHESDDGSEASADAPAHGEAPGLANTSACASSFEPSEMVCDPSWFQQDAPVLGSGRSRVQERFGLTLAASGFSRQSHQRLIRELESIRDQKDSLGASFGDENELQGKTGWVTLVKDGVKLVSSRLRLDVTSRDQQKVMWARRIVNSRLEEIARKDRHPEKGTSEAGSKEAATFRHELDADPISFAFGGVYPGVLHAHGKLHESHRVSYSLGTAGQYLLHVRLRLQAAALPGSPFFLQVDPGEPYALGTRLPCTALEGEVGTTLHVVIKTADRVGNVCTTGGGDINCLCSEESMETSVVDRGDGTYELQWLSTRTGFFETRVKIAGKDVENSPMRIHVYSSSPDLAQCELLDKNTSNLMAGQTAVVRFRFRDVWGNHAIPGLVFRSTFKVGAALVKAKEKLRNETPPLADCSGSFVDDNQAYEVEYIPPIPGKLDLYLYGVLDSKSNDRHEDDRIFLPGMPLRLIVGSSQALDADPSAMEASALGMEPQDYKVARAVLEEAQGRWGACTIDAFASAATAVLPRFWSAHPERGAEATDAFMQDWKSGERLWVHPPPALLSEVCQMLQRPDRLAEAIVCAPVRQSADWYYTLSKLADETQKFGVGRLTKVADDAPARLEEWPIQLWHIPPRATPKPNKRSTRRPSLQ